jgi:hypothetical protein
MSNITPNGANKQRHEARLMQVFGTAQPEPERVRNWLKDLRLRDCFWRGYPTREIRRTNDDINAAKRALAGAGEGRCAL